MLRMYMQHVAKSILCWNYNKSDWNKTSKFRELWSPARQQIWPWSRSKVTVKVTTWYHRKGLVTKNTHAKYKSSTCKSAKVMTKVKVFVTDRRTDRQTDRQTDEWDLMSPRFRESGGQQPPILFAGSAPDIPSIANLVLSHGINLSPT